MNKNIERLLKLIAENPDLPVVPVVDTEVVADEGYYNWLGSFGVARIDRCFTDGEIYYFEEYDKDELLDIEYSKLEKRKDLTVVQTMIEAEKAVDALNWVKCIVVPITSPKV